MSDIRKQVAVLWELRKIDDEIRRIKVDLERIPAEVTKLQATAKQTRATFDSEKTKVANLEKRAREAEREVKLEDEYLAKSEAKMSEVKNNTEFQAATREQEDRKKLKAKIEEVAIKALSEVEGKQKDLKEYEAQYLAAESKTLEECAALQTELAKLHSQMAVLETDQAEKVKHLSGGIAVVYVRLATRGKGSPIASVDQGMCQACHVRVRPQLYNEVIGFKQIHQCSHCGKLLVCPPSEDAVLKAQATAET